jgi:hypothetical protein
MIWKNSVHAKMEITCDLCHGGNPRKTSKDGAHNGVYNSGRPQSTVYFKKVPATCGRCHRMEYTEFKRSIHFKELQASGRGPNCVTCHESKTGKIIQPTQVVETCSVCHNERLNIMPGIPLQAYGVLLRMVFADEMQAVTEEIISLAQASGKKVDKAKGELESVGQSLTKARAEWHTFSLDKVEEALEEVFQSLKKAREHSLGTTSLREVPGKPGHLARMRH